MGMTYFLANNFTAPRLFEKLSAEMESVAANLSQLLHVRLLQQQHSPTQCVLTAPAMQLWGRNWVGWAGQAAFDSGERGGGLSGDSALLDGAENLAD